MIIDQTVSAGSLKHILRLPHRHFVAQIKQDTARACQKSYFSINSVALTKKFQCNTPQDIATTLKNLYSTADPAASVTWGEMRGIIGRLRRLDDILALFVPRKTKARDWTPPENVRALAKEAEDITQQLESGPLHLGRTVVRDNSRSVRFTEKPSFQMTPDGAK